MIWFSQIEAEQDSDTENSSPTSCAPGLDVLSAGVDCPFSLSSLDVFFCLVKQHIYKYECGVSLFLFRWTDFITKAQRKKT